MPQKLKNIYFILSFVFSIFFVFLFLNYINFSYSNFIQAKTKTNTNNNLEIKTEQSKNFTNLQLLTQNQNQETNSPLANQYAGPFEQSIYTNFLNQITKPQLANQNQQIKGLIVPHHLLAGKIIAQSLIELTKQNPSTIILIGPNHFERGNSKIISSNLNWKTPFGILETNNQITQQLLSKGLVTIEEDVIKEEHSIYSLISFIKNITPNTKVIPFILKNKTTTQELDTFITEILKLAPKDTVFISSIDFSHYQNSFVADFHDELSKNVIQNFDFDRLSKLEIDSIPSLYTILSLMQKLNSTQIATSQHNNSAKMTNNLFSRDTTSYYSPIFVQNTSTNISNSDNKEKTNSAISILHFGDIMLDRSVLKEIQKSNVESIFENLAGSENRFFKGMDLISANLEGPFGNKRRFTTKSIAFNFDPTFIPTLKNYGFNIFSLANNHSYDMGKDAFEETKNNLGKYEIEFYGKQYGIDDDALFIKNISNKKIAFLGFNDTNSKIDIKKATELIQKAETLADFTILNIHWGDEYKLKSNANQQKLAHEFILNGVDLIIGHHPHVIQEIEIYKNKPIFYSLGNFIFDQYFSQDTQQGLAVGTIIYSNKISVYLFPIQSQKSKVDLMNKTNSQKLVERILPKEYSNNSNKFNFEISF